MSMFDNYENQDAKYIPDNMHDKLADSEVIVDYSSLQEERDIAGRLIGYKWDYGNTNNFYFTVNKKIYVPDDALLYTERRLRPTEETVGTVGQKCYNLIDIRSWTCKEVRLSTTQQGTVTHYIWEMDERLTSYEEGKEVRLSPDMSDKLLLITFTNWKGDAVFTRMFEHTNSAVVVITREMSENTFVRGLYTCAVAIVSDEFYLTEETINFRVV